MDDDSVLRIRDWGYYEPPPRHLGLQLRPSAVERDAKPFLSHHRGDSTVLLNNNGGYHHSDYGVPEPHAPMDFISSDGWMNHRDNKLLYGLPENPSRLLHGLPGNSNKLLHGLPGNPSRLLHEQPGNPNFSLISETSNAHQQFHMQPPPSDTPNDDKFAQMEEPVNKKGCPLKKRLTLKSPKTKKPKKPKDETLSVQRSKPGKHHSTGVIINGIDLDIAGIPTPVCSCTGIPQQCYRWGCGGWQSACCTTSISMYPLPMSTKRRGARIAGRKMSQGAFKKVLEKLVVEGYNLSNPIDLRTHWAKHGTNKFVTIR